jgi:hypothetical protein
MAGQPCANHPNEITFVRCGRCEKPICTRCMVDSPVGKKCRACAKNQTHLEESSARQVAQGFIGAVVVAIPAGWLAFQIPLILLAFPYGWLVGEVGFRASQRSRSLAVQAVVGVAALVGALVGGVLPQPGMEVPQIGPVDGVLEWNPIAALMNPYLWFFTVFGTLVAVSRVRYL